MLTSIDVKLPSSFACFRASLADLLQIADVIRRVISMLLSSISAISSFRNVWNVGPFYFT